MAKKKLTSDDKKKLDEHAEHHTDNHMILMKNFMMDGDSFAVAHKKAQKKVGK